MRIVVADWETFYSDDYTLSKMSTESYIRDPRFEAHGVAIKWSANTSAQWYDEREARRILAQEDWSDTWLIHHHAQFDGLIESHHYGVHPRMLGCTLAMARLLLGNSISVSLDSVRKHFGLAPKITPYHLFKGRHWSELEPSTRQLMGLGACDEVESIWQIFNMMGSTFPREEFEVIDTIVKMFTEPVLQGNLTVLGNLWQNENIRKQNLLAQLNVQESELQSADRFADLLRAEGVEPGLKLNPKGTKEIYAFAKTDQFMRDLLEDEDDRIRTLAEARLGVKSTILQTRAETLGWMARRGPMCVYLNYAGAGTLRPSGGDGANWLNLKRQNPIRRSVSAPAGFLLAPADSSQIECRVLHYLAGGPDEPVVKKFRNNEDPYVDLASQFYGEQIYKPRKGDPRHDEMEAKRGMGKQGRLMCGYGAAGLQFKRTARNGQYGPPVDIPIQDADNFVSLYRRTNPSVCAKKTGYWAQCELMLGCLSAGNNYQWGPLTLRDHRIYLPNGCAMIYDTLHWYIPEPDEECREFERNGYWRMRTRQGWKKMWGSKLTQNICEAVSRVIVSQAMIRLKYMGYRALNWPYDELCLLVPDDGRKEEHEQIILREMRKTPDWLPDIPLDAEVTISEVYSK